MRTISVALIASSMLFAPAVFADELVIDEGVGPEFHTYVEREKVRTYDGDIVVGADLPTRMNWRRFPTSSLPSTLS